MNTIKVKDYSVSGEKFTLKHNVDLDMLETTPQPTLAKLPEYYKSEDYISHTDTKRNLFEKMYHWVRSYMLNKKVAILNRETQTTEKNLLDIGCGTGDFLKAAKTAGWNISGVEPDVSARSIASSKTKTEIHNLEYLLKLKPNSFDAITMWHVLEHVPNLEEHINLLSRLIKKEGTIIIAVPNYKSFDAQHYGATWAAYDVPRHLWHFSRNSIQRLFAKVNLNVVKNLPMKFDAYYVSLLSEKYKNGSMNPIKAFLIGFRSNWKARSTKEYSSLIYIIKAVK